MEPVTFKRMPVAAVALSALLLSLAPLQARAAAPVAASKPLQAAGHAIHRAAKAVATAGGAQAPARAAPAVPANLPVADGTWSSLGPTTISPESSTGRAKALAVNGANLFVGGADGGIWEAALASATSWTARTDGSSSLNLAIGAFAVDPNTPSRMYAGTGEMATTIDALYGQGVYSSSDSGASWTLNNPSGVFTNLAVSALAVDSSGNVFAATAKHYANGTGIYESTDHGSTWNLLAAAASLASHDVTDLAIGSDNTIYAAVGDPGGSAAVNGIWSSSPGPLFTNTTAVSPGLTGTYRWRLSMPSAAAHASQVLWAVAGNSNSGDIQAVIQTGNGGASWTNRSGTGSSSIVTEDNNNPVNQAWYDLLIAADPAAPTTTVYVGTYDLYKTSTGTDVNPTWADITNVYSGPPKIIHPDQQALLIASGKVWVANDGGVFASGDGGATWASSDGNLNLAQFYGGAVAATNPNQVLGGLQDNGTIFTGTAGPSWTDETGGDGFYVAIDPTNASQLYAEYPGGILNISTTGAAGFPNTGLDPSGGSDPRVEFAAPLILDPNNPAIVYSGRHLLWRSTNHGVNWLSSNPTGLPAPSSCFQAGCVHRIAVAVGNSLEVFVVDTGSNTYRTNPAVGVGGTWTQASTTVAVAGSANSGQVTGVAIDPNNNSIVYETVSGFSIAGGNHVFKSIDLGANWTDVSAALPNVPFESVVTDAATHSVIAGSDNGAFISTDGGASWDVLGSGLPNARIDNLVVQGFNAYAFTHGRGAWVVPLFHFAWSGQPASTAPGSTFSATVSAVDANGAAITGYRGTVHFASSDPHPATLPADYTFTAGDNGAHVFSNGFALFTTGTQTITASEVATANSQGLAPATTSVTVSNVIADHLVVSGPVSTAFGTSFSFTVTARDPSNSVDTSPRNVDFSSSDPSAVLPANNSALTSGVGTFSATLNTIGSQTITATDHSTPTIKGTTAGIAVLIRTAGSTLRRSYHLDTQQPDRSSSWFEVDPGLRVTVTIASGQVIVLGGNMDLWTSAAGFNQDVGIFNGTDCALSHLLAWKESGGFAGTFSPNAAFVQTVVTTFPPGTYTFTLCWKANKPAPAGTIYGGAGTADTYWSPTSLTAKVLPAADVSSVVHSASYHLDVQQPDRASTWYPVDAANLQIVNYKAPADGSLLLGANMDLWTTRPGYNQDVAIFSSVDCSNPANRVTWKESGGFAGTFSPNAAYAEGSVPVSKGQLYSFTLCWKANQPAPAGTIYGAAGTADTYFSPTRLTAEFVPSGYLASSASSTSFHLDSTQSDVRAWYLLNPSLTVTVNLSTGEGVMLGGNMDLWTTSAGYNQDLGIFLGSDCSHLLVWKESGGFAGTFSPNAAYVQTLYHASSTGSYTFTLCWKGNKATPAGTIYGAAGTSDTYFSPSRLTVELTA